jgi:glucose-6-phosphate dehydrogenase assembly protein OpcA
MAAPSEYRAVLGGQARAVDVGTIEHELTQLWKAAAEDTLGGQPVVRACVLNLVAYAPSQAVAHHIDEVVSQVSGRHPSRSIVMLAEPGAGSSELQASISAHCRIAPEGGKQVCSEQITLRASGRAVDELHGTVLPLLVPDLPVFLWWHDELPPTGHLFRKLLDDCDRLVVDSGDLPPQRSGHALVAIHGLVEEGGVAVADLNWSRLSRWRELVAQFYDSAHGRQYLDRLDHVQVEVASRYEPEPHLTEGLLLVGWLASRLGWVLEDGRRSRKGAMALDFRSAAGRIAVAIGSVTAHPGEGLHSIRIGAHGRSTFSASRMSGDERCVTVMAEIPEGGHSRVVCMDSPSEATLLSEELDLQGRDTVFEEALAQAVRSIDPGR